MPDEPPYMTSIPGRPVDFFKYKGRPCLVYLQKGVRKAARFEPPDRFYPMDPWIFDYGDLAGAAYPQPISQWAFDLYVQLDRTEYEVRKNGIA